MSVLMSLKRGDEESALQHCLQHSGLVATAWTAAEISPFVELFKLVFQNGLGKDIVKMTFGQPNYNRSRGNRGREGGGRERLNQDECDGAHWANDCPKRRDRHNQSNDSAHGDPN